MGVNVCGARPDDVGEYPGFREPHLGARRSRDCVHLFQIWTCRASEFCDEAYVCGLVPIGLWRWLLSSVAIPRQVWYAQCCTLCGVSTKRTHVGLVCPDDPCRARSSRADSHNCCCEV